MIGTVIDIQVSVKEFYRYTGDTQFQVTKDGIEMEIAATWIAPGDVDRQWAAGDTVTAYTNGVGGAGLYVPQVEADGEVTRRRVYGERFVPGEL